MTICNLSPQSLRSAAAALTLLGCAPLAAALPAPAMAAETETAAQKIARGMQLYESLVRKLSGEVPERSLNNLMDISKSALQMAPDNVDAMLLRAAAIGLKSRQTSNMMGFLKGYPQEARDVLKKAVAKSPQNARAHGFLACWNLDVIRRGGASGAKRLGASTAQGLAEWDKAATLGSKDVALLVNGAYILLASKVPGSRSRAIAALKAAKAAPASGGLATAMAERGLKLLGLIESGDERGLEAELAEWTNS